MTSPGLFREMHRHWTSCTLQHFSTSWLASRNPNGLRPFHGFWNIQVTFVVFTTQLCNIIVFIFKHAYAFSFPSKQFLVTFRHVILRWKDSARKFRQNWEHFSKSVWLTHSKDVHSYCVALQHTNLRPFAAAISIIQLAVCREFLLQYYRS